MLKANVRSVARAWPFVLAGVAACGLFEREPRTLPAPPADAGLPPVLASDAPAPRDDGHLPPTVTPIGYRLAVRIDPTEESFSGNVTIDVEVPAPTPYVVLDGEGITITRAAVHAGGTEMTASTSLRPSHGTTIADELVLTFPRSLPVGRASITIAYGARFASDLLGLYRVEEAGRWYAYSQFEPTHARRAFPCFDEPGFKVPFDVRIIAPAGVTALSNTPQTSETPTADGWVEHAFTPSPPLPSYLVAFAVGPFDVREGPSQPFPIRVVTTKGRSALGGLAIEDAVGLAAKLEDYFDLAYPYAKLDLVAVPDFAPGAMENPGLITFRDTLLLVDPSRAPAGVRRAQAVVIAHELAHQWVGDLVTMKWWDDVWLNEGFATWAQAKVVDQWRPEFGARLEQIAGVQGVMDLDAMESARAVREPVRSTGEASEAFDGLTYDKGAAVLRMLEAWLGEDTFRRGIQRYVREYAWKNARADDLLGAIDYVSTQHVGKIASAFLDQSGVPELVSSWKCAGAGGRIELRESEWRPLGEPRRETPRTWTLPVCLADGAGKLPVCFTVGSEPIVRLLGGACPAWVYPNADQTGYYRFLLEPAELTALVGAQRSLGVADRIGLVSNAWAAVRQGAIPPSTLLDLLPAFDGETNRLVVDQILGALAGFEQALVDASDLPAFRRYVGARLAGKKRALGWMPSGHAPDDDDRILERRSVLQAEGTLAADHATIAEADRYATAWLRDPRSVSADTAMIAVPLASLDASPKRLDELRAAARSATTPQERTIAIGAMGMFDDPASLRNALDLTLTHEFRLSELRYLFGSAQNRPAARAVTYAWIKENWAKIKDVLPPTALRGFAAWAGIACTVEARDDTRAFFVPAMQGIDGAKRGLDEALERADLCVALRAYGAADVARYFAHH